MQERYANLHAKPNCRCLKALDFRALLFYLISQYFFLDFHEKGSGGGKAPPGNIQNANWFGSLSFLSKYLILIKFRGNP